MVRRFWAALVVVMLLLGMSGFTAGLVGAEGDGVAPGTTLPAGTLAVTREVNNPARTVVVTAGNLASSFTTTADAGDVRRAAWQNYSTMASALAGGCQTATDARNGGWASGYTISYNGQVFNGNCGGAPSAPPTTSPPPAGPAPQQPIVPPGVLGTCDPNGVMRLTAGTWSPTNTALINREHNWTTRDVWIWTTFGIAQPLWVGASADGHDPLSERAVWIRCDGKAWSWILDDAMTEAANVAGGSLGYTPHSIHVNGQLYTGAATPGVKASQRVADGVTIPAGSALITRQSYWDTRTVWIWWTNSSPGPLTAGWSWDGNGQHHQAIWTTPDYKPWGWIEADACAEAVEVWKLGLGWYPKHLYINGVEQPTPVCPDP